MEPTSQRMHSESVRLHTPDWIYVLPRLQTCSPTPGIDTLINIHNDAVQAMRYPDKQKEEEEEEEELV